MSETLFPRDPAAPAAEADGAVRLDTADRTQLQLEAVDLEALLPPTHAARLVWRFVEGLDLRAYYDRIRARAGHPGRPPIDPKILVALWLYATIEGVGSAREVARLCAVHDAYRWLRGGVSVNYHTLSDFRVREAVALDGLLTQSITALLATRVVTLDRVTQDGTKVRANAGVRSFRGRDRLAACRRVAQQQVARTRAQLDGGASAQQQAAQRRAAAAQLARVEQALATLPAVDATKRRNRSRAVAKVSTTDPEARVMKLMDGGFRPAYNVQFATDMDSHVVVGVAVTQDGSDQRALVPMVAQITARTGRRPACHVVDGGYVSRVGLTRLAEDGVTVVAPVPKGAHAPGAGQAAGRHPAITAWRARMATDAATALLKRRGAVAERLNGDLHAHRWPRQLPVRGLPKVLMCALWAALTHNMMRAMAIVPHLMT